MQRLRLSQVGSEGAPVCEGLETTINGKRQGATHSITNLKTKPKHCALCFALVQASTIISHHEQTLGCTDNLLHAMIHQYINLSHRKASQIGTLKLE